MTNKDILLPSLLGNSPFSPPCLYFSKDPQNWFWDLHRWIICSIQYALHSKTRYSLFSYSFNYNTTQYRAVQGALAWFKLVQFILNWNSVLFLVRSVKIGMADFYFSILALKILFQISWSIENWFMESLVWYLKGPYVVARHERHFPSSFFSPSWFSIFSPLFIDF